MAGKLCGTVTLKTENGENTKSRAENLGKWTTVAHQKTSDQDEDVVRDTGNTVATNPGVVGTVHRDTEANRMTRRLNLMGKSAAF